MQKKALIAVKAALTFVIVIGLFLVIHQKFVKDKTQGIRFSNVIDRFLESATDAGPIGWIRGWFEVNPSNIAVSKQEELTSYKLQILSKSLNNYFQSLLADTQDLISTSSISDILHESDGHNADTVKIKSLLKKYLKNNLDIAEVSLYSSKGEKLTSVKYRSVKNYLISKKLIDRLHRQDNVLVKNGANKQLVLISAIRNNKTLMGVVTQTLNPVFFTKILDFLNINDNLFYIKNPDNELVIDNYSAYAYLNESKMSFPYLFYRKLTKSRESMLSLNIDNVNYAIGVIIDENNLLGNMLAFLFFIAVIYIGIFFVSIMWKNSDQIKKKIGLGHSLAQNPIAKEKNKDKIALHDEIEAEIKRIKTETRLLKEPKKEQLNGTPRHAYASRIREKKPSPLKQNTNISKDANDDDGLEISADQFIQR